MRRIWCSLLLLLALTVTLQPLSASILAANITTDISVPDVWTYTIFNNEVANSPNFVDQFTIAIDPTAANLISVTATPAGWADSIGLVNGVMSIQWWSNDPSTDLAPGSSLGGFSIFDPGASNVLANADINSADHSTCVAGLCDAGPNSVTIQVDTPLGGGTQVPEPWTGSTVGLSLLAGSFWLRKKSRRTQRLTDL
ncbi:MAG TPA: hypothetical protein VG096_00165 [Bryobacteraceae bacterium]|nr:hypothetical protein [Bryobacteraceae bacterium]